jgi:hypothetical protein
LFCKCQWMSPREHLLSATHAFLSQGGHFLLFILMRGYSFS